MSHQKLEEGATLQLDFSKLKQAALCGENLIPAVAQDIQSKEVLIIAYVNEKALRHSLQTQKATFWSTSRNELWEKGSTSGDSLLLKEIRVNCEQNSILYLVELEGQGACHTKQSDGQSRLSCFYRKIEEESLQFI